MPDRQSLDQTAVELLCFIWINYILYDLEKKDH